MYQK
jgi:hypothetical protein